MTSQYTIWANSKKGPSKYKVVGCCAWKSTNLSSNNVMSCPFLLYQCSMCIIWHKKHNIRGFFMEDHISRVDKIDWVDRLLLKGYEQGAVFCFWFCDVSSHRSWTTSLTAVCLLQVSHWEKKYSSTCAYPWFYLVFKECGIPWK